MTGPHLLAVTRATARAVRWPVPLGAWLVVAGVLIVADDQLGQPGSALMVLRGVAAIAVLGAVFLLDDDAGVSVAASPTSLAWRRVPRVGFALAVVAVPWTAAVWRLHDHGTVLPLLELSLEPAALLALALGAAATAQLRVPDPAVVVAPVLAVAVLAASQLPEPLALLVGPGPAWDEAHGRWISVLVIASAVLCGSSRDPAVAGVTARRTGGVPG